MAKTTATKTRSGKKSAASITVPLFLALLLALSFFVWKIASYNDSSSAEGSLPVITPVETIDPSKQPQENENLPAEPKLPEFSPAATENTLPGKLISSTDVTLNGEAAGNYAIEDKIDFGLGSDYTDVQGIVTFRGNNFRDSASYGTANIVDAKFSDTHWTLPTSSLQAPNGSVWTGSGWVGQPLMMTWSKEVRAKMNMYDWAKNADTLTEVIYATMDGNIYFMDLETGSKTRDPMNVGYTFKGAGALDPRGYPILYLGAGYDSAKGRSRAFVINLLDCSIMYEFGSGDPFSLRGTLSYFDGSALVDAETDRLIYPGENGILYIIKLNTKFDAAAGTLSINPSDVIRWRYNGVRSSKNSFWWGMEDSPVIWRGHIIMSDNGGNLMCLDLNTLKLDWVQDVLDDTNCTPVLELEDGHPYVYTSTSFRGGWRAPMNGVASIPIWKIDAVTGEIVWQKSYDCYTEDGVSGGTQGTLAIGKNGLSDLIFVPVARTPDRSSGVLTALNKHTGEVVWEIQTQMYSWSSPVAVYDQNGKGYLVFCTAGGYMYLIDGLTHEVYDHIDLGSNVEASPAVFNNTVVVGTRGQSIWGVKLT